MPCDVEHAATVGRLAAVCSDNAGAHSPLASTPDPIPDPENPRCPKLTSTNPSPVYPNNSDHTNNSNAPSW